MPRFIILILVENRNFSTLLQEMLAHNVMRPYDEISYCALTNVEAALEWACWNNLDLLLIDSASTAILAPLRKICPEVSTIAFTDCTNQISPTTQVEFVLYKDDLTKFTENIKAAVNFHWWVKGTFQGYFRLWFSRFCRNLFSIPRSQSLDEVRLSFYQAYYQAVRTQQINSQLALFIWDELQATEARYRKLPSSIEPDGQQIAKAYRSLLKALNSKEVSAGSLTREADQIEKNQFTNLCRCIQASQAELPELIQASACWVEQQKQIPQSSRQIALYQKLFESKC